MASFKHHLAAAAFFVAAVWPCAGHTSLINADYAVRGDRLLVTDTTTGLQYLSPYATRGLSIAQVLGGAGGYLSGTGLTVADPAAVRGLIASNFPSPLYEDAGYNVTGTVAGYQQAGLFFGIFGINEPVFCAATNSSCPRTQGWTMSGGTLVSLGMIQNGTLGGRIDSSVQSDSFYLNDKDLQSGTWLVRSASVPVPAPPSFLLLLSGLGALTVFGRRGRAAGATG